MNKRGDTQKILLYVFYLFMIFLIIFSTSKYMSNYFNGIEFNKEFISKDLGTAIDTLSFSPSKIEMKYNLSNEYILDNKEELSIKRKEVEISKKYKFISKINEFSIKSDQIIVKKDSKLTIN